tara:strand:+ start:1361 stop:1759 length:399 start_codon:yes stop_codon:yes gene_type:complete
MYTFIRVFGIIGVLASAVYLCLSFIVSGSANLIAIAVGVSGILTSAVTIAVGSIGLTVTENRVLLQELLGRAATSPLGKGETGPAAAIEQPDRDKALKATGKDEPMTIGNVIGLVVLGAVVVGAVIFAVKYG